MSSEEGRQILSELDEVALTTGKTLHVPKYLENGDVAPLCGLGASHDANWRLKPADVYRNRSDRVCKKCTKKWNEIGRPDPKTLSSPLTTREADIFLEAYQGGYFERPRGTGPSEIAAEMGLNKSTVTELLRYGIEKVVEDTDLENDVGSLTDRQREVLQAAFGGGYFGFPRGKDGEELADELDIATATVYQHLREAIRKVVEQSPAVEELTE